MFKRTMIENWKEDTFGLSKEWIKNVSHSSSAKLLVFIKKNNFSKK